MTILSGFDSFSPIVHPFNDFFGIPACLLLIASIVIALFVVPAFHGVSAVAGVGTECYCQLPCCCLHP